MARPIPIGTRGEASETVELKHTLSAHHAELPPVYSTPDMIQMMETACFQALQPYCDEGEITVGISIHIEHRAASGVGMRIHAEAKLESFDGRFYIMRVRAHDGRSGNGDRCGGTRRGARPEFRRADAGKSSRQLRRLKASLG